MNEKCGEAYGLAFYYYIYFFLNMCLTRGCVLKRDDLEDLFNTSCEKICVTFVSNYNLVNGKDLLIGKCPLKGMYNHGWH